MANERCPVWLMCGGQSPEHEISLSSGRTAAAHVDRARYAITPAVIRRDGQWAVATRPIPADADEARLRALFQALDESAPEAAETRLLDAGAAASLARASGVEAAMLILHGEMGEDGTIQGLMEMAGIPYTGSGVLASSLAMDKIRCQKFLAAHGLPTPPFLAARVDTIRGTEIDGLARRIDAELDFPCVVKPSRGGSSVGVSIVREAGELPEATAAAARVDPWVMFEAFQPGEECTCGVIEIERDGSTRPTALPATLIRPIRSAFFDYAAKYTAGETEEVTPAPFSEEIVREIQTLSLRAFEALGCRDMARVDFILTPDGPRLLEVNTIPGLTPTSLLPQGAAAAGIGFSALLGGLIDNARRRNRPVRSA